MIEVLIFLGVIFWVWIVWELSRSPGRGRFD